MNRFIVTHHHDDKGPWFRVVDQQLRYTMKTTRSRKTAHNTADRLNTSSGDFFAQGADDADAGTPDHNLNVDRPMIDIGSDPRCPYEVLVGISESTLDRASAEDERGLRAACQQLVEDQLANGAEPWTLRFPRAYLNGRFSISLTCAMAEEAKEVLRCSLI